MNFSRNRILFLAAMAVSVVLFAAFYLSQEKFFMESLSDINCEDKNRPGLFLLDYYGQDIEAIYVLFHGDPNKELSADSKLRSLAVLELLKNSGNKTELYFVGGKTSKGKISGAEKMKIYLTEKCPSISDRLKILNNSNNTNDNIKDIISSVESEKDKNAVLISNAYHIQRINNFLKKFNFSIPVLSAEEIIKSYSLDNKGQMEKYKASFEYSVKKLREKEGILYQKADPNQNFIRILRNIERNF